MPSPTPSSANDLVSQAILRSTEASGRTPVPLIATSYDISITGGLADIVTTRTFRNGEAHSIEAALTFPVPVTAVLYSLEARIGGRPVKAVAKARTAARETYEDAVDRGKTAVLHEELLKGVHMISVAHVAPGTEIVMTARFALTLSFIGGKACLRIPTTVGDVYGTSGLPDSDELNHGGPVVAAQVKVTTDSGTPVLRGETLTAGAARMPLDRPIDIEVFNWSARDLKGRSADGCALTLTISPSGHCEAPIDTAILVDHSGSMQELCTIDARLTKHAAVLLGLSEAAHDLRNGDRLNLWEFDDTVTDLGTADASTWRARLRTLSGPHGGTEIGHAIDAVLDGRPAKDVLLITDGKSHALDVHRIARRGARFSIVLIGDDSLEANVGHLAALTGGEVFIASGADVAGAVRAALASLRRPREASSMTADGHALNLCRAGMTIACQWHADDAQPASDTLKAVAALAASLKLPHLAEAGAAALAEDEGLVTHLTSLILVDEDGEAQAGLPQMRKVALPSPATYAARAPVRMMLCEDVYASTHAPAARLAAFAPASRSASTPPKRIAKSAGSSDDFGNRPGARPKAPPVDTSEPTEPVATPIKDALGRIDWRENGARLTEGNVVGLPPDVADIIDEVARVRFVRRAAARMGLSARALVIGLLARAEAVHNRYADRVARALLGKVKRADVAELAIALGLMRRGKAA